MADGRDNCEGQGVVGRVTVDGCPDADLDGITDAADSCPGTAGVPAAAPYNGCPDGPRPPDPSSTPFLRIESRKTGDPYSTASRKVDLHLNWPKGAESASIRNRGGKVRRIRELTEVVPWRLPRTRQPRIREVRVRFEGPRIPDLGVGDTIILDPTRPEVEASVVLESIRGWYVGLDLGDRGTGISSLTLLDGQRQPIPGQQQVLCMPDGAEVQDDEIVCKKDEELAVSVPFREPAFVEVVDVTGNTTLQPLEKLTSRCAGSYVPYRRPTTDLECMVVRQRCGDLRKELAWRWSDVRCRSRNGSPYHVVEADR